MVPRNRTAVRSRCGMGTGVERMAHCYGRSGRAGCE